MHAEKEHSNLAQTIYPEQIEIDTELDFSHENFLEILKENQNLRQENLELKEELEKSRNESLVDPLTDCLNLRYFNKFLDEHFNPEHPEFDHNKTAFIYIDIDGLGAINNKYRHEAGNLLIKTAAEFFIKSFHEKDIVIRIHGDEFVIICENYNNDPDFEDKLKIKIKKIMELAKKIIIVFEGNEFRLRFSAGAAAYNMRIDKNPKATCSRSEIDMYVNKEDNRSDDQW
ncbi:MAG: GGDEF domain-containing protein [Candidatus Saccharibacteria bacterium]